MSISVFLGPTLPVHEATRILSATYHPPAAQGDVYAAAAAGARAIGIIDGYFERVPAVWHKEVLWALSRGVHVFGASSLGALRAAELHTFGMRGVGRVFEAFRDGLLEDDDEVTVVHGPRESGYRAASVALVDIRFTLAAARAATVISAATEAALVERAKSTYYPERAWQPLLVHDAVPEVERRTLAAWLAGGRVEQKRLDAIELLERLRDFLATEPPPLQVRFSFQHTDAWEQVRRQIDARALAADVPGAPREHAALLDELRLEPDRGAGVRRDAMLRALALALAEPHAGDAAIEQAVATFRALHRIEGAASLQQWCAAQLIAEDELLRLLSDEARIQRVLAIHGADLERHIVDALRLTGTYAALQRRARDKQQVLAARGLENPSLMHLGIEESDLWQWFYHHRHGAAPPHDIAADALARGFDGIDAFRRAVLREYCFRAAPG